MGVDLSKIGAQGQENRSTIKTQSSEDRESLKLQNRLEAKTRANQSMYARSLAGKF